jgi:DNA-binding IclR family transcriptional regulator
MPRDAQKKAGGQGGMPLVSSLARGMSILACFNARAPELTVSEIARRTGLPQPTAWRLCRTLMELGFLLQVEGRQSLKPTLRVLSLGYSALAGESLGALACAKMQEIASRYEGAVSLGVRDGLDMVYVQRRQGSHILFADLRVGSRVPLATSATGWAYIAGLDAIERETLFAELAESLGPAWPQLEARLAEALQDYAVNGYVVNRGAMHAHVSSVAVPVRGRAGGRLLALSSGGIATVFTEERLQAVARELATLAEELSEFVDRQDV